MSGKRVFLLHAVLLVFLWPVLLSCTQKTTKDYGGSLRIGIFHKPTEINPLTTDSSISANLLELLFNTLVRLSGDGTVHPELASQWSSSADGLEWTFHLRQNVLFHDGSPVRADDVKFTYDTIVKTKKGGYSYALQFVKEIRVLDPYTLQIVLSRSDNSLWDNLGVIGIVPKKILEVDPDYSQFNRHPIGSGPYRFVKQDEGEIILEANPEYFGGRPYLDRIVVMALPSQQANLNYLIAGKIDMVFLLNPEDYGALEGIPTITVYNNWYPILHLMTFNLKNDLFKNADVRRAFNLAINKQAITDHLLKGKGSIAGGTFAPGSKDFNPEVAPYPYRPDLALEILKKQGWRPNATDYLLEKGGRKFEFSVFTLEGYDLNSKILQMIQGQLRQIGVKMNIKLISFDEYVDQVFHKRNFESAFFYLVFRPFQNNNFSFLHSSQIVDGLNFSSYANPQVDVLLEEARFTRDPEKQGEILRDFQKIIHDDPPGIFLFWRNMPIAVQARFRDVPERRMESLRDLVNVWVPKELQ